MIVNGEPVAPRYPRVSGDRPLEARPSFSWLRVPPRQRGSALRLSLANGPEEGTPASAGIGRKEHLGGETFERYPRVSGDRPNRYPCVEYLLVVPPRQRGSA